MQKANRKIDMDWEKANIEQVWKQVALKLAKDGIETVLVGGAVVSIYSDGAYESGDLDFIQKTKGFDDTKTSLLDLGFKKQGRSFVHDESNYYIEFCSGPLAIGDDLKIKPEKVTFKSKTFYILSPTDCIRDRLASYAFFKARECLDQAVLVAKNQPYNDKKIKSWCKSENILEAYEKFRSQL